MRLRVMGRSESDLALGSYIKPAIEKALIDCIYKGDFG